ncbi:MAG: hypothetical protein ABIZ34_07330 [Candidatus Limnocylindrales bacterium]
MAGAVEVGLEIGPKRKVFAQAIGWPGWCRAARDEERAMTALAASTERYRAVVGGLVADLADGVPWFEISERVAGDVTTDFGAPGKVMGFDRTALDTRQPERLVAFLDACWAAFDTQLAGVSPKTRGVKPEVGRSPEGMRAHIGGALRAYAAWLAKPVPKLDEARLDETEPEVRAFVRAGVLALPTDVAFPDEKHPGAYMVRRECWHVLDHAWELEDRLGA